MYSNEVLMNERKGLFNPDCIHLSLKGTSVMTQTLYPPLTPTTSPLITRFNQPLNNQVLGLLTVSVTLLR